MTPAVAADRLRRELDRLTRDWAKVITFRHDVRLADPYQGGNRHPMPSLWRGGRGELGDAERATARQLIWLVGRAKRAGLPDGATRSALFFLPQDWGQWLAGEGAALLNVIEYMAGTTASPTLGMTVGDNYPALVGQLLNARRQLWWATGALAARPTQFVAAAPFTAVPPPPRDDAAATEMLADRCLRGLARAAAAILDCRPATRDPLRRSFAESRLELLAGGRYQPPPAGHFLDGSFEGLDPRDVRADMARVHALANSPFPADPAVSNGVLADWWQDQGLNPAVAADLLARPDATNHPSVAG